MEHEFIEILKQKRDWLRCHNLPMVGVEDEYEVLRDPAELLSTWGTRYCVNCGKAVKVAHQQADADNQKIGWMIKTGVIADEL